MTTTIKQQGVHPSSKATLLVELRTEELPPKNLRKLSEFFAALIVAELSRARLIHGNAYEVYATPRRLAVSVPGVLPQAPAQEREVKGPAVTAALDEQGQAKPALLGFAKKCGVPIEQLQRAKDAKGEYFVHREQVGGAKLANVVTTLIEDAAKNLPVAKIMRWGGGDAQFVRPVQGVLVLHGQQLIPAALFGLADQTATTLGHRFLAKVAPIAIGSADDYETQLERDGAVIASFDKRKARIAKQLEEKARGAKMFMDDALLEEVTALTEWPVVYEGQFDAAFLAVPQECLILTMQQNQRYFPLAGADGKLTNRFLVVSNLETNDPKDIIAGNERVLRARLADAKFFYEQDKKKTLEARVPQLANVVYHNKLGSQLERVLRIQALAGWVATEIGANANEVEQAAYLCKADLLTGMVGEFPELQGVMGNYYAGLQGCPAPVAQAIEDHYRPRFAGDTLPKDMVGTSVALGEKTDTLVGIFGIGQIPTGDKDPFGLRRQALGVLRILLEKRLPLDIKQLFEQARAGFVRQGKTLDANVVDAVFAFTLERLRNLLREGGASLDEVEAVVAVVAQDPKENPVASVAQRLDAVRQFKRLPQAEALIAANKRIVNILRKFDAVSSIELDWLSQGVGLNPKLYVEQAEKNLANQLSDQSKTLQDFVANGNYLAILKELANLRGVVDTFFEKVLVDHSDEKIRANRIALLRTIDNRFKRVADVSKLSL
jgi:glycyl-tRNA synthetase beta chain